MKLTENDVRQDEHAKDYIDLSHLEMPIVEDLSEYLDLNNIIYENLSEEQLKKVIEFALKMLEKK